MEVRAVSESVICSGSGLNHRTFAEDESWNSLQSTILAGNYTIDASSDVPSTEKNDLTTVDEEDSILSKEESEAMKEDDNILNMNIDAISDDEVFFDCPSYKTPKNMKELKSPIRSRLFALGKNQSPSHFLSVDFPTSYYFNSASDSGVEEEKTGTMLAQILNDFNHMQDHAQSTPKLKSMSSFTGTSISSLQGLSDKSSNTNISADSLEKPSNNASQAVETANTRKKLNFSTAPTVKRSNLPSYKKTSPVNVSNKENYYAGKYSSAVTTVPKANPKLKSPAVKRAPPVRKVARIKEFFESCSRSNEQSRGQTLDKSVAPRRKLIDSKSAAQLSSTGRSPVLKPAKPRSSNPSFNTHEMPKLLKTPRVHKLSSFTSSGTSSFLLRNQASDTARSSSCSDFPSTDKSTCSSSSLNRSRSTSDLSGKFASIDAPRFMYALELRKIATRPRNPKASLHKKPSPAALRQHKRASPLEQKRSLPGKKSSAPVSGLTLDQLRGSLPGKKTGLQGSEIMKRRSIGLRSSPVKPVRELRKVFSPTVAASAQGPNQNVKQIKKLSKVTTSPVPAIVISGE